MSRRLLPVLWLLACSPPIEADRCLEGQCAAGQICVAGRCGPAGGPADMGAADLGDAGSGWTLRTPPCPEGGADALIAVGDAVYAGCGAAYRPIHGLFRSDDLGASWTAQASFSRRYVADLDPAPDGGLYVTSYGDAARDFVVHLTAGGSVEPVYVAEAVPGFSHVVAFARRADGVAMAAAPPKLVFRGGDDRMPEVYDYWDTEDPFQPTALTLDQGLIYGVARGAAAPEVLLPLDSAQLDAPFFERVRLTLDANVALVDLTVADGRMLAVGYEANGASLRGVAVLGSTLGVDPSAWRAVDLVGELPGGSIFFGTCAQGDHLMVVGQADPRTEQPRGLVFASRDGGESWADVSPAAQALSWNSCWFLPDGSALVSGEDGFAVWRP